MVETPKLHIPQAQRQDWETPPRTFDYLDGRFGPFDLDAACTPDQLTALTILARGGSLNVPPGLDLEQYGLPDAALKRIEPDTLGDVVVEAERVWLNPPFNQLAEFLKVVTENVELGVWRSCCVLMPARTDTAYWQEYVFTELRYVPKTPMSSALWKVDAHPTLHSIINLRGRLTFVGADAPYTQPCVAVLYGDVKDKEHP